MFRLSDRVPARPRSVRFTEGCLAAVEPLRENGSLTGAVNQFNSYPFRGFDAFAGLPGSQPQEAACCGQRFRGGSVKQPLSPQFLRNFASILGELPHDLLVQPHIHRRRVVRVAGVVQLLRKLLARR